MTNIKNKQIIIIGQRRSGTSMISGILYYLGVSMGADATQVSVKNEKGFFEDRENIIITEKMLSHIKMTWLTAKKYIQSKSTYDKILASIFVNQIQKYCKKKNEQYVVWGFKNVNHILFWQLYTCFLSNPYYIIITRDIDSIASSIVNWHGNSAQHYLPVVKMYANEIKKFCKNKTMNKLELTYEQCLINPVYAVDSIIQFCQLTPTSTQRNDAIKHIAPSLKHI